MHVCADCVSVCMPVVCMSLSVCVLVCMRAYVHVCAVCVCRCACLCVCGGGVSFYESYFSQRLHVVTLGSCFFTLLHQLAKADY